MPRKDKKTLVVSAVATAFFIVANFVAQSKDVNLLILLPLSGLVALLFILRLEAGMLLMALLTPFAVTLSFGGSMRLSMPVEPMLALFSLMFLFRVGLSGGYDWQLLRHPVSVAVLASIGWFLVTACTSLLPWVSFKYLAARLWFVIPFFFAAAQVFRAPGRIRQVFWCYALGLAGVVIYSTARSVSGFSDLQTLHRAMTPFYNDHTAYGCALALVMPVAVHLAVGRKGRVQGLMLPLLALLLLGLGLSYSRAAWISVVTAAGVFVLVRLGLRVRWMLLLFALGVGVFFYYQNDVLYQLGKNRQDSSLDLKGQIESISNISTDASNVERLNRWASALRLWRERPILGTGPGTYQFLYASQQRSYQLSTISTNAGNLGNAHSEYIGPLAEQGVVGAALVAAVFALTFAAGVRVYRTAKDTAIANLALALTLGLLTYYVHGIFNDFLDTDKLSVPFWAFTAAVVALDVYAEKTEAQGMPRRQTTVAP